MGFWVRKKKQEHRARYRIIRLEWPTDIEGLSLGQPNYPAVQFRIQHCDPYDHKWTTMEPGYVNRFDSHEKASKYLTWMLSLDKQDPIVTVVEER